MRKQRIARSRDKAALPGQERVTRGWRDSRNRGAGHAHLVPALEVGEVKRL